MLGQHPEKFPLLDMKTSGGGRVIIGPCAVPLVVRTLAIILVAITLCFFGPALGKELSILLRALGI
jgi:hypothetical protein